MPRSDTISKGAPRRGDAGWYLLEFTTAAGVLVIVASLGIHLMLGLFRQSDVEQARLSLLNQGRAVRHALLADVRRSSGVLQREGRYHSGPATLILRLPASAEARCVVYDCGSRGIERVLVGRRGAGRLPDRDCLAEDLNQATFRSTPAGSHLLVEATVGGKRVVRRRSVGLSLSFGAVTRGGAS